MLKNQKIVIFLCLAFCLFFLLSLNNDIRFQLKTDLTSTSINYYDSSKVNTGEFKIAEDNTPFTISEYSPIGELPAQVKNPTIYVLFSHPVVPMSKLGSPADASRIMKIEPETKGTFRWYGTKLLSFEPADQFLPQREYTVTISDGTKSLGGKTLTGSRTFGFITEQLKISSFSPEGEDITFENAKKMYVGFNYPVNPEVIKKYIKINSNGKNYGFSVSKAGFTGADRKNAGNNIYINVSENFSENSTVYFTLLKGARSEDYNIGTPADIDFSFSTLKPFIYKENRTYSYYFPRSSKGDSNPVYIEFSHPVNKAACKNFISVSLSISNIEDYLEVYNDTVKLSNLPVTYDSTYTVTLKKGLEDIYGRKLQNDEKIEITVPPPARSYYFPNTGTRMLEAQFAPKIIFEYQNVYDGVWKIGRIADPYKSYSGSELVPYDFSRLKPNVKHFEIVDLSPYLNSKRRGFVGISWNFGRKTVPDQVSGDYFRTFLNGIKDEAARRQIESYFMTNNMGRYYWLKEEYRYDYKKNKEVIDILNKNNFVMERNGYEQRDLQVQVTDLGITTRYAYNKILVWVNYLSTGQPAVNANVSVFNEKGSQLYKTGNTDKNGLAVITLARNENKMIYKNDDNIRISAEKDGDKADFMVNHSHNIYHNGIYNVQSPENADNEKPQVFMFTDRGIYRPGETVTYRGIDRNLVVGEYFVYKGFYEISSAKQEHYYYGQQRDKKNTIFSEKGNTSESGGFYGSFKLPDDLEPGFYEIIYERGRYLETIEYQVANFRRLSFQVNVKKPKIENYFAGDTLSFTVKADYLSGGAMAGASCEYYWMKSSIQFKPKGELWKSYKFGSYDYEGNTPLGSGKGTLNQDGELTVKQLTEETTARNAAYSYALYAKVEDIDRQVIQGTQSATVHPSSFYIGAKFTTQSAGYYYTFLKKGETAPGELVLVKPDGTMYKSNDSRKIIIRTNRMEWKIANQQGVNDRINTRYEPVEELEKEEIITSAESVIKFSVKPEKSGVYRVYFETRDDKKRKTVSELAFFATGSDWTYWGSEGANDITLIPDKEEYKPGDTAKVLIMSALPEGYYLLTIEREGILEEKVIKLSGSANIVDIPVKDKYLPVFYAAVSSYSVRKEPPPKIYEEPDLGKPKGYFGIVTMHVLTDSKQIRLEIINSKPNYLPGSDAEILIRATKNGKPLPDTEITYLACDRGVLDLINYHVPDPIAFFYNPSKFPLAVFGADSRSMLMDPVTYEVKDLQGGAGDEDSKLAKRKDFRPTAVFEPYLKTDKFGEARVKFKLPDSLTTFRSTAIAVNMENFGISENEILVQNPVNVRTALPRKLRLRDTSFAGVVATNLTAQEEEVSVTVDSDILIIDGEKTKKVKLPPMGTKEIAFKIAAVKEGEANISFTTITKSLKEKLEAKLVIEQPLIKETFTTTGQIDPKKTGKTFVQEGLIIPKDIAPNFGNLKITLDDTKLNTLTGSIKYLYDYPFGCLEQRSSKIYPLVLFGENINSIINIFNAKGIVEREISLWAKYQNSDGGFPFWLESGQRSSYFISVKVAKLLFYAKKNNFKIPSSIKIDSLLNFIQRTGNYHDYESLYSLFVLSLWGKNVYLQAEEYFKKLDKLDASDLGFLSLVYWNLDKKDRARQVFYKLNNSIKIGTQSVDLADINTGYYFNSDINKLCLLLMIYNKVNEKSEVIPKIINTIMSKQKQGYWGNTYTTQWVITAFAQVFASDKLADTDFIANVVINGQTAVTKDFKRKGKNLLEKIISTVTADKDQNVNTYSVDLPFSGNILDKLNRDQLYPVDISMKGTGILYYTLSMTYALPFEIVFPRDEGFSIYYEIRDMDDRVIPVDNELLLGETYKMKIVLSSSKKRQFVILRAPVPSGAEILDSSLVTTASYGDKVKSKKDQRNDSYWWYYNEPIQKIYDNEVQYMFDYFDNGVEEVEFLFRTTSPGAFPTPPVSTVCMYEEEVFGRTGGKLYYIMPK